MTRIIKFRAWLKERKTMIDLGSHGSLEYNEWETGEEFKLIFGRNFHDDYIDGSIAKEDMVLMQWIGMVDHHGKEIYEGDIVRINHPQDLTGDFTNAIGQVYWSDDAAAFYHSNNHGRPPKRMWEYVEVIGNIHENPEIAGNLEG